MLNDEHFCPYCAIAATLVVEHNHVVHFGGHVVVIEDEFYRCSACGEKFYTHEQAVQRSKRIGKQNEAK